MIPSCPEHDAICCGVIQRPCPVCGSVRNIAAPLTVERPTLRVECGHCGIETQPPVLFGFPSFADRRMRWA